MEKRKPISPFPANLSLVLRRNNYFHMTECTHILGCANTMSFPLDSGVWFPLLEGVLWKVTSYFWNSPSKLLLNLQCSICNVGRRVVLEAETAAVDTKKELTIKLIRVDCSISSKVKCYITYTTWSWYPSYPIPSFTIIMLPATSISLQVSTWPSSTKLARSHTQPNPNPGLF